MVNIIFRIYFIFAAVLLIPFTFIALFSTTLIHIVIGVLMLLTSLLFFDLAIHGKEEI